MAIVIWASKWLYDIEWTDFPKNTLITRLHSAFSAIKLCMKKHSEKKK